MNATGDPTQVVTPTVPVPVAAGTTALLQGNVLYVAGTPAGTVVGSLSVLNLATGLSNVDCTSATPVNCQTVPITDGYHDRIQMGSNGQLFIGSTACTSAGCLSIFNTISSVVTEPPAGGDVTGIDAIPLRNVVYVCQGGLLRVYDTTTDALKNIPNVGQPNVLGEAIDVKAVDF